MQEMSNHQSSLMLRVDASFLHSFWEFHDLFFKWGPVSFSDREREIQKN